MTAEPLAMTAEAVALTEMKMDMTLDHIIMVSKKSLFKAKKLRVPSKKGGFSGLPRDNFRVQNFMESKSSLRQQVVGQQKQRPRTLDSLFANLKEQRMHQQQMPSGNSQPRHAQRRLGQQWSRGRAGGGVRAANSRATNRYTR